MPEFIVEVPEVWYQVVFVEARSEEHAIKKVQKGDGEYSSGGLTYSHTLEEHEAKWQVQEA